MALIQPTYYVRHPDETYSVADPQPVASEPSSGERSKSQMLADRLDSSDPNFDDCTEAAIELRRLHSLTGELSRVLSAPVFNHALALDVIRQAAALLSSDAKPASEPEGGPAGSGGWKSHAEAMEHERDYYRARAQTMYEHQRGEFWYWQGDGHDHPESMANSLPVVIRADDLRALIAAGEPVAVPQDVLAALDRMCTPLDESRLSGATAESDARCMKLIRDYVLSAAPSTTPVGINGLTESETNASDSLYWRLHSLSKALESSGRIDEHEYPDAYATILDAMLSAAPQPLAQTQEREAGT